jgi:ribosomal protein S27E
MRRSWFACKQPLGFPLFSPRKNREHFPVREDSPQRPSAKSGPQKPADKPAPKNAGYELAQQSSEYRFLPVQCPNCGMEGKVKISRLDRTFTCKQCKKVFHCALDGTVSGERPAEAQDVDPAEMFVQEPQDRLSKWIESLPRVWQVALLGVAGLLLAYGVSLWMEPAKPLPGELEDRAAFAAKALARGQWKQVKRLAKPKTAGDLGRWYDKVRPKQWADVSEQTAIEVVVGKPTQQVKKYEKDKPVLDATVLVGIEVAGMPEASQLKDLSLHFSQDEEAQWWLDGERMLADTAVPQGASKGRKPAPKEAK